MADQPPTIADTPAIADAPAAAEIPAVAAIMAEASASAAASPSGTGTGTVTPALSDIPLNEEQRELSLKVSLADLSARATSLFAHRNYEEAAEAYANAVEKQAEMNGEMSPDNAEILFLYGRCLFKLGQEKSDVLGGKAPETKSAPKKSKANGKAKAGSSSAAAAAAAQAAAAAVEDKTAATEAVAGEVAKVAAEASGAKAEGDVEAKKPLFQFEGDEDMENSDEDEVDEQGEGEDEEEEEDDLALAFGILDMARLAFNKQLEAKETTAAEGKGKDVADGDDASVKHIKERLADTHSLLSEISLENERFPEAIVDQRESLRYKKQLYPEDSGLIAESHYMLSLALEFASITLEKKEGVEDPEQHIDQGLRDEAAIELEAAITCQKLKQQNLEVELATLHNPEDNEQTRKEITALKENIAEMEIKLTDLKNPPFDVKAALGLDDSLGGLLGAAKGESAAATEARIEEAKKTATDLTSVVRKKKKEPSAPADEEQTNGKRKAEDEAPESGESKKARVDDAPDVDA